MRDVCVSSGHKSGKSALYCAEKWRVRVLYGLDSLARLPVERGLVIKLEGLLHDREAVVGRRGWRVEAAVRLPLRYRAKAIGRLIGRELRG